MSNTNIKPRTCPFCNRELIFVNENNPNKIQYYIHDDSNNNKCFLTAIGGVIISKDDIVDWNRRDGETK